MKAFEMFKQKYEEWLKRMSKKEWERITENAAANKMTIPDFMMMCLEISINEANPRKNADVYWELVQMNNDKLVASNSHRQASGQVTKFWFTKKGLKEFNKIYNAE